MEEKATYFQLEAPDVDIDGTYEELLDIVLGHNQVNSDIIKRAAEQINTYIEFNMNIDVYYWCKCRKKYTQYFLNGKDADFKNYKIKLTNTNEIIYADTDLSSILYPNITGLVKMWKEETGLYEDNILNMEDMKRKKDFDEIPYGYLLSKLLDGHNYF